MTKIHINVMEPVNLMSLNSAKLKEFLASFDHVFSDCDGVIWSKVPSPGVGAFFDRIKQLGKTVHFVSNNSMRSRKNYENLFEAANIKNGFENLTVPSIAIVEYLKSVDFNKAVYCVTCPETINVFKSYGLTCKYGPDIGAQLHSDYVQYLEDDKEIGAVVFDSDFNVNLAKMYKAISYLQRPEVLYFSGATDRYVPMKPGCLCLGTGIFTDIVSEEANREPISLGKPGKLFGEFAMKRAGVTDPSRVLFIGDIIEANILRVPVSIKVFDAQVVILEHKSIICAGYSAVMHIHCAAEEVTVKALICLVDKKTGEKSKTRPRFVKQDQVAIMRIECAGVICLEPFKKFAQMGRFTLRDENKTIAIGKVLKVIE